MEKNNIEEVKILLQQYERRILSERMKEGIKRRKTKYNEKK